MSRPTFSIALCIQLVLGSLAVVALGGALLTTQRLDRYNAEVTAMARVQEAARLADHMNGLVHATVSESRGIYMSRDVAAAERFIRPMRQHLDALRTTLERFRILVGAADAEGAELARVTEAFIRFRTEMIQATLERGPAAADALGNNEANRANRQALNKVLLSTSARLATAAEATASEVRQSGEALARALLSITVAGVALALVTALLVVRRRVTGPLARLTTTMRDLAADRLDTPVPEQARRDEIGEMARALDVLKARAQEVAALRATQERERAEADVAKRHALRDMAERLEAETRNTVASIEIGMQEMRAEAERLASGATAAAAGSQEVAGAAAEAMASTESMAAAAEELSASIRAIAQQVNEANVGTQNAVARTEAGVRTIGGLAEAVEGIDAVARLIADIAARTNLLALNATIEAARAGEAGKGFAVVAGEVKALAAQTARSTDEISRRIAEVSAATTEAVTAVRGIGESISALQRIAAGIGEAMGQQDAATAEIARSVARSAQAGQQVSYRIAAMAEEASRTGAGAASVNDHATAAADAIGELRTVLVRTVRTATAEVDRRFDARHHADLAAALIDGGGVRHETRVADISTGGCSLDPAPSLRPGTSVRLEVAGLGLTLPAEVVAQSASLLRLRFVLDDDMRQRLQERLERHLSGKGGRPQRLAA